MSYVFKDEIAEKAPRGPVFVFKEEGAAPTSPETPLGAPGGPQSACFGNPILGGGQRLL